MDVEVLQQFVEAEQNAAVAALNEIESNREIDNCPVD
jgi:hypothetical protein